MTDITDAGTIGGERVPELVCLLVRLIAPQRPATIEPSRRLIGDLGYHSLAMAELGFTLEDLFGLEPLPPERAMSLHTLGDVTDLIMEELDADAGRLPDAGQAGAILARYGVSWPACPT